MEHAELRVAIASNEMRKSRIRVVLPAIYKGLPGISPSLLVQELAVVKEKSIKRILSCADRIRPSTCQAVGLGKVDIALMAVENT